MKLIKLGAAALNQTPLDWSGNKKNIIDAIDKAIDEDVDILCLPELCITGYGCEDTFLMPSTSEKALDVFFDICKHIDLIDRKKPFIVSVGLPMKIGPAIYNCTAIIQKYKSDYDNIRFTFIPKQNLCSDGVHYESRWFKAWEPGEATMITFEQGYEAYEFGDCIHDCYSSDLKLGVEICEDAWSANRPGSSLASRGVDIILNPSASHFSFGKNKIRERFVEEGSRAFRCAYVYANLLGNESGRVIFDGDTYIASAGQIVSRGLRFSFKKFTLTTAVIDIDKNRVAQMQSGSLLHHPEPVLSKQFAGWAYEGESGNTRPVSIPTYGPHFGSSTYDAFTQAVALGLWDYMLKSRSKGFVLSLSGGADSAAVACLVRSMVICAFNEFGRFELLKVLKSIGVDILENDKYTSDDLFIKSIVNKLLLCVYQGTENSSNETELAASRLAGEMGASYQSIYVQNIVDEYLVLAKQALGREPSWEQDDIAMQNIQARVRAPSVWMLANIRGSLLLSTSNRSEAAVGYATMDGDTCGGLSPIAGVSKQFILDWLDDYSRTHEHHDFHGLNEILKLKPTAELRPQDQEQTDEDDLMPYPILAAIEEMVVKYKMSPRSIVQALSAKKIEKPLDYVIKFFNLFTRNQWKRERYAPSFHLDDESLDPKTFYRFPILNSGFKEELDELLSETMKAALE